MNIKNTFQVSLKYSYVDVLLWKLRHRECALNQWFPNMKMFSLARSNKKTRKGWEPVSHKGKCINLESLKLCSSFSFSTKCHFKNKTIVKADGDISFLRFLLGKINWWLGQSPNLILLMCEFLKRPEISALKPLLCCGH